MYVRVRSRYESRKVWGLGFRGLGFRVGSFPRNTGTMLGFPIARATVFRALCWVPRLRELLCIPMLLYASPFYSTGFP